MSPHVPNPMRPPLPAQLPSTVPKQCSPPFSRPPPPLVSKQTSSVSTKPSLPSATKALAAPHSSPTSAKSSRSALPCISILEKLIKTCPVWLQLGITRERATRILNKEMPGIFLVRRDTGQKTMVLSVRLPDQQGAAQIQELLVKEERSLIYLEGSVLVFDNIFKLIAFYCVSRDILPFTLKLPQVIIQANKYEDMEVISTLGLEFWGSALNIRAESIAGGSTGGQDAQGRSSCEIQLTAGNDKLWYINPIFIEEYYNSLPPAAPTPIIRSQSLNTPIQAPPKYKRPPPLPPRPLSAYESPQQQAGTKLTGEEIALVPPSGQKGEGSQHERVGREKDKEGSPVHSTEKEVTSRDTAQSTQSKTAKQGCHVPPLRIPPVPIRRRLSEKQPSEESNQQQKEKETEREKEKEEEEAPSSSNSASMQAKPEEEKLSSSVPTASLICLDDSSMTEMDKPTELRAETEVLQEDGHEDQTGVTDSIMGEATLPGASTAVKKAAPPIPPPRTKKLSQTSTSVSPDACDGPGGQTPEFSSLPPQTSSTPVPTRRSLSVDPKLTDVSLYAPEGGAPQPDHDSYSTSSTEEEADTVAANAVVKRSPTIMLDRAKQRLSMVNLSNVFTTFMNAERKLQKRIVELARDNNSYFGNLVRDYRAFTLDTMRRHTSSTEMLQEIRQMMTQLKSYLIQSAELQNIQEAAVYSEEKLEVIIEAALCKSVLKPLREAVYNSLRDIHTREASLKKLRENQQVVLGTTTTDLGITTSVPEMTVMEKIQVKLGNLHQEYSPQRKIDLLLKACKMIYESMSVGSPGKAYGADDFLPVLMYVLARSNITALLLDVEYMMELMDPALQLGEGSYYLTTTYGALEHIKNYDKQAMTRQLSREIQDSIHRWERRRTLNKARASRSSVQDFINVSFLEAGSNTKTLGVRPNTSAQDLAAQCAEKFEVLEPESYCLSVLVEGHYRALAPEEFPLTIKSSLHHSEPRKEYYFVYRPGKWAGQETDNTTSNTTSPPPDSLI
ncbi:ras and Rab interactor 3 [Chanos chanos]|uniref:Ras and Rab interactor 3 n=1 Tax=Chanos chanos TaxID=29144 RepID=A0A6J2WIX7_CHACN|nr:ras and Rab interactor 3 [Chanos chanos]